MNLTDFECTPIFRVFEMVKREAERYGASIGGQRDRGPNPQAHAGSHQRLLLAIWRALTRSKQILENRLGGCAG